MKTVAIGIENLCVPCHASCKYCLLSSCHRATGVSYERGKAFARRFYEELQAKRPDLGMYYYIGYCMDTPDLADYIRFSREIGSPAGKFLQFNGFSFREEQKIRELLQMVVQEGIERIDLTFYGTQEYHDRFAGRSGDFDFLLQILDAANAEGLTVDVSLPLTRENADQADDLLDVLSGYHLGNIFIFLPHSKGRGRVLNGQRLTREEFEGLSGRVKSHFSKVTYMTEGAWIRQGQWPETERRTLTLCLTPDNIEMLESMSVEEIITHLEELDDQYTAQMPAAGVLAAQYGEKSGERMFRIRDLLLLWQQRYLQEHPEIYDMNEETHHFSVHA